MSNQRKFTYKGLHAVLTLRPELHFSIVVQFFTSDYEWFAPTILWSEDSLSAWIKKIHRVYLAAEKKREELGIAKVE